MQPDAHLVIMVESLRPGDLAPIDECAVRAAGIRDGEMVLFVQLQYRMRPGGGFVRNHDLMVRHAAERAFPRLDIELSALRIWRLDDQFPRHRGKFTILSRLPSL